MSDPVQTTATPPQDTEFDPLEFWIRYKSRIMLYGGVIVAGLLIFGIVQSLRIQAKAKAEAAYAAAKTADDFRKVSTDYSSNIVGANAELMLAGELGKEGKTDEAIAALRKFTADHGTHPLISGAYLGLGSLLENQGKADDALAAYQKITQTYLTSYAVPAAWMGQARVFKSKGQIEEARRAYETVIQQFPETGFGAEAKKDVQSLEK